MTLDRARDEVSGAAHAILERVEALDLAGLTLDRAREEVSGAAHAMLERVEALDLAGLSAEGLETVKGSASQLATQTAKARRRARKAARQATKAARKARESLPGVSDIADIAKSVPSKAKSVAADPPAPSSKFRKRAVIAAVLALAAGAVVLRQTMERKQKMRDLMEGTQSSPPPASSNGSDARSEPAASESGAR